MMPKRKQDLTKMKKGGPVFTMRLPLELTERLDRMSEMLTDEPDMCMMGMHSGRVSRSATFRLALSRGLDALEKQFGTLGKRGKRR
jgi:hypothetical protein